MDIAVTYDLRDEYLAAGLDAEQTAEFDRPETIAAIAGALRRLGHRVQTVGNLAALTRALAAGRRWDLVFNIAEGLHGYGREAQIPALLEGHDIPYTFSDPLTLCLALHKGMAKRVVRAAGVATPDFAVVEDETDLAAVSLPWPLFVKPVAEGTSKGIAPSSRVADREALERAVRDVWARHRQPALVECYLPGREFTVGILGGGRGARTLGVLEVLLGANAEPGCYSFDNKEHYEGRVHYRRAVDAAAGAAADVALAAWRALGARDAGRVDVRLDANGGAHFLEANPLAGLHPERSDLAILARLLGIEYDWLIATIVEEALARRAAPAPLAAAS